MGTPTHTQTGPMRLPAFAKRLSNLKKFPQLFWIVQEGKTFEESVTTSNCDATWHNGNWYKLSFAELQTGQWLVLVRIVCVSLHQLILGSMNKQSWNWISLVISQLKNFDILVNKFFNILICLFIVFTLDLSAILTRIFPHTEDRRAGIVSRMAIFLFSLCCFFLGA